MATVTETLASLTLEGVKAEHVSPEGQRFKMSVDDLMRMAQSQLLKSRTGLLPPGVRDVFRDGSRTIWVGEFAPTVRPVCWITPDSPVPYGPGTKYGMYSIATPYVILLGVFDGPELTGANECFFRTTSLLTEDDELLYPALLNVSRIRPNEGRSLAWVCTQHLNRKPVEKERDPARKMAVGWRLLCETLFDASFNLSSEHHEGASWYGESKKLDKRLETIDAWQAASLKTPSFILDVPFHKTGFTLKQVIERIFTNLNQGEPKRPITADDLVRLMVNHTTGPKKPR